MSLDLERLTDQLCHRFGGSDGEVRVVTRQANDLADSGHYETDVGTSLTTELVLAELADAPDGTPADRWNWWIGALEVAYGGYSQFGVRQYQR